MRGITASFVLFVLSLYGEGLGGRGFATVLSAIALQAPLDSVHGELSSDTQTLIYPWEIRKIGEIWGLKSLIICYTAEIGTRPFPGTRGGELDQAKI